MKMHDPHPPQTPSLTFILYEPNGAITTRFTGLIEDAQITSTAMGKPYLQIDQRIDPALHFVENGEIVERPASTVLREGNTLLQVPVPSRLWIRGEVGYPVLYEVTEPRVEIDFPFPGTYVLTLESFPFRDIEFTMVAP